MVKLLFQEHAEIVVAKDSITKQDVFLPVLTDFPIMDLEDVLKTLIQLSVLPNNINKGQNVSTHALLDTIQTRAQEFVKDALLTAWFAWMEKAVWGVWTER